MPPVRRIWIGTGLALVGAAAGLAVLRVTSMSSGSATPAQTRMVNAARAESERDGVRMRALMTSLETRAKAGWASFDRDAAMRDLVELERLVLKWFKPAHKDYLGWQRHFAQSWWQLGEWDRAAARYEDIVRASAGSSAELDARRMLAQCYLFLARPCDAAAVLEATLERADAVASSASEARVMKLLALEHLAWAYSESRQPDKEIQARLRVFNSEFTVAPSETRQTMARGLAQAYREVGDRAAAAQWYTVLLSPEFSASMSAGERFSAQRFVAELSHAPGSAEQTQALLALYNRSEWMSYLPALGLGTTLATRFERDRQFSEFTQIQQTQFDRAGRMLFDQSLSLEARNELKDHQRYAARSLASDASRRNDRTAELHWLMQYEPLIPAAQPSELKRTRERIAELSR